jgi:hypothetical protein
MEHTLVIDVDGSLLGLWSDELIGLYEVERGGIEVERASHVEFISGTQRWHVFNPDGVTLMQTACGLMWENVDGWLSREDALAWEKEEIERRLIEGS